MHVAIHQSFVVWKSFQSRSRSTTTKLDFILKLIKAFHYLLPIEKVPKSHMHVSIFQNELKPSQRKRCYYKGCERKTRIVCYGCRMWLCKEHINIIHQKLLKNKKVDF